MVFRAPSLPSARQGSDQPVLTVLVCLLGGWRLGRGSAMLLALLQLLALLASLGSPGCSPEAALAAPQDKHDRMAFIMTFPFPCSSWF